MRDLAGVLMSMGAESVRWWGRRAAGRCFVMGLVLLAGCGGGYGGHSAPGAANSTSTVRAAPKAGTRVSALEFLYSFENDSSAPYFPVNGIAGCGYGPAGTLMFCDQKRGKVHALDPMRQTWYEFDTPVARPYTPLDVKVDGFKVLVLDPGGGKIYRFDLNGTLLDVLLDLDQVDPGFPIRATAFDVDQDGRMIITDESRQQVLLLDSFLNLTMRLGDPGSLRDQFQDPMGLVFRVDGSFLVSDQGNRRLDLYGRLGFFEDSFGGVYEVDNPFVAPAGLDHDRFGNVFVADPGNGRIHVLDPDLTLRLDAGPQFSLQGTPLTPVDVAVGPGDLLAVTDVARVAVLVYRIVYQ